MNIKLMPVIIESWIKNNYNLQPKALHKWLEREKIKMNDNA